MPPFDAISVAMIAGTAILTGSLFPMIRVWRLTGSRAIRRAWVGLGLMILGFIAGYLVLAAILPRGADPLLIRVISLVLLMGSVFVWSVARLAEMTAEDVARLARRERDAIHDALTGLHNRRYFEERLEEEVARARRRSMPLALVLADIDRFKSVNDTFGHPAGDRILAAVANTLLSTVRDSEIVARYGGEEFAILAPAADPVAACGLAERLCAETRALGVTLADGRRVFVAISAGAAVLGPSESGADLVARADLALYQAKRGGRDRAVFSDPGSGAFRPLGRAGAVAV